MLNLHLAELPACTSKGCPSKLLPVEDISQQGTVYLKGWFCPACKESYLSITGRVKIVKVEPDRL